MPRAVGPGKVMVVVMEHRVNMLGGVISRRGRSVKVLQGQRSDGLQSPYSSPPSSVQKKEPRSAAALTHCSADYFALTVMVFERTSSALGRVMVRIPFSNSALALSATTAVGRIMLRSKAPQRCSRMW
jgi:hypothetical protein